METMVLRRCRKTLILFLAFAWFYVIVLIGDHYFVLSKLGLLRPPGSRSRLCMNSEGRLGNHLFKFASMFGIARSKGLVPLLQRDSLLVRVFELNGIIKVDNRLCESFVKHRDIRDSAYDSASVDFSNATDIALQGYFQSWKYFKASENELRRKLRIKSNLVANASEKLERSIKEQLGSVSLGEKTFVGIHVRRGDYLASKTVEYGYVVATREYLQRATDFFRSRFNRVIFVVCSEDLGWCKKNVRGGDVVFIEGQSAELDFTTLTLCNHTIMTVGSFGWWSAWLTNGITLYYKHQFRQGSDLSKVYNLSTYFPPEWIAME
ncbi:galactoside alpha-(1,2)-fucosyltransferase 2-like [Liolophura sinensis]|uniref:galactoside alpha-(1,2)-fucosyltransferase 2-like n=1 Tax=Liolophura sinensis TaxID=3198878 RepID=UPI003158D91E